MMPFKTQKENFSKSVDTSYVYERTYEISKLSILVI